MQRYNLPYEYGVLGVTNSPEAGKFPLILKGGGYVSDKRLAFGVEQDPNDILLLYPLSGVAEFFKGRELKYINVGELVVSACNYPMKFRAVSAKNWECMYFVAGGRYAKFFYNLIRTKSGILRVDPRSPIIDCFCELIKGNYDGSTESCMRASRLLTDLFSELYEATCRITAYRQILPARDSYVNVALRYIAEHFTQGITVDDVCSTVGFSKHYFCKVFKENTGMTIHKYINECRINRGKELLTYSKLSVAAIAAELGYKSTLTFIRGFRACADMTPSEYRQNF